MTTAPATLLAARSLLLQHLPGLTQASVGIVGDPNHRGGYHCGRDRVDLDDYSVRESRRDRDGLTLDACALDIGSFLVTVGGKRHDLRSLSIWLVSQCKAGTADTRDIREVIYSTDGQTVRRWDRLGIRTTGDSSHRWHTHISYHRDAIKAGRDQAALFRRYLVTIGLLQAAAPREDTEMLTSAQDGALSVAWQAADALLDWQTTTDGGKRPVRVVEEVNAIRAELRALTDLVKTGQQPPTLDYDKLALALLRNMAAPNG